MVSVCFTIKAVEVDFVPVEGTYPENSVKSKIHTSINSVKNTYDGAGAYINSASEVDYPDLEANIVPNVKPNSSSLGTNDRDNGDVGANHIQDSYESSLSMDRDAYSDLSSEVVLSEESSFATLCADSKEDEGAPSCSSSLGSMHSRSESHSSWADVLNDDSEGNSDGGDSDSLLSNCSDGGDLDFTDTYRQEEAHKNDSEGNNDGGDSDNLLSNCSDGGYLDFTETYRQEEAHEETANLPYEMLR